MITLIKKIQADFPKLRFASSHTFAWSPKGNTIIYIKRPGTDKVATWSLLHELGHALLEHNVYQSDFELLKLEIEAWEKAKSLAQKYGYRLDEEHIQNCLDTYRDWLYQRSTCPSCTATSLQINKSTYSCFNCGTIWHVSQSKHCRPYRMTKPKQKGALA